MKGLSMATATAALMALGALAAAPAQADQYILDFETDGYGNALAPGTIIDNQWENLGVQITHKAYRTNGNTANRPLMLFNSSCKPGENGSSQFTKLCTGGDNDLATGTGQYLHGRKTIPYDTTPQGNVLIIDNDNNPNNGPNDWANGGGLFTFKFEDLVTLDKVTILDVDKVDDLGGKNYGYLKAYFGNDVREIPLLAGGDNGLKVYGFDDLTGVTKLEVRLPGSGAISGVEFTNLPQFQANNDPVDVPEPASTLGLLALGACGVVSTLKRKRG